MYASIVEAIDDSLYVVDQTGRYLFINKSHASRLGFSPEAIVGKYYSDFHKPAETIVFLGKIGEVFTSGQTIRDEYQDEKGRFYLRTFNPSRNNGPEGPITAVVIISRDITERYLAEESLRQSETKFRTMIENIADGYFEVDLQGNITDCNEAAYLNLDYPRDEFLKLNFTSFVEGEDVEKVFKAFNGVFRTGIPLKNLEFNVSTKGGAVRNIAISATLAWNAEGKKCGFRGLYRDITELRESQALFQIIAKSSPIGIYALQEGRFHYLNQRFLDDSGYQLQELLGKDPLDLVVPEDRAMVQRQLQAVLEGRSSAPYEIRTIRKSGEMAWNIESLWPIQYRGEKSILGSRLDITEQKAIAEALRQSEERYRSIIEHIEDGYYETDLQGRFTFFNESLSLMLGYARPELQGASYRLITEPETIDFIKSTFSEVYRTGIPRRSIEWVVVKKDGSRMVTELSASLRRDDKGSPIGFRGIIRDITERKNMETAIKHLAYYDVLTGLPNRRLFEDRLNQALANTARTKRMIALLMLDVDNFKEVNDTLGHEAGDTLLVELGRRLTNLLRKVDTVARLGGDEFIILLPEVRGEKAARTVANKIIACVQEPIVLAGRAISITTSIGIALHPGHGNNSTSLIKCADDAMYRAKKAGKNRYRIYSGGI